MPIIAAWFMRVVLVFAVAAALAGCEFKKDIKHQGEPATPLPYADAPPPASEPAPDTQPFDAAQFRRFGLAEPLPKASSSVRLATYNIENLFDDVDDPSLTGEQDDAAMTKPYDNRVAAAQALRRLDADVVALQEVESEAALRWFLDLHASDLGYEHIISLDAGDTRGIEQSVISRYPLSNPRQWVNEDLGGVHPELYGTQPNWEAGKPMRFRRSPLAVDVTLPGDEIITLIVVHQKSGRQAGYWREAEARRIVAIAAQIEAEHPERAVFLLGDFNAEPTADSVRMYLEPAAFNITGVPPQLRFVCGFADQSGPEIITHASGRRIDLILANAAALRLIVPGSAFVLGTTAAPEGVPFDVARELPGYASDHYPVSIDVQPR